MSRPIPAFRSGSIEEIARSIGDIYTGSTLTRVLQDAGLKEYDPGIQHTKWRRLAEAMNAKQQAQRNGNATVQLIKSSMQPERHIGMAAAASRCRDELNVVLSLSGLEVLEAGNVRWIAKVETLNEAQKRERLLRSHLERSGAHGEVIKHCRPELLKSDYYEAVFESIKGLGARLRTEGNVNLDGRKLVQATMQGQVPVVSINDRITETQKNEQTGIALLAEGLFAAFRNPAAHEPHLTWTMSEQDALDVLGLASLIHRRLDGVKSTSI